MYISKNCVVWCGVLCKAEGKENSTKHRTSTIHTSVININIIINTKLFFQYIDKLCYIAHIAAAIASNIGEKHFNVQLCYYIWLLPLSHCSLNM